MMPNLKPRICIRCQISFKPNSVAQKRCSPCKKVVDQESKYKWRENNLDKMRAEVYAFRHTKLGTKMKLCKIILAPVLCVLFLAGFILVANLKGTSLTGVKKKEREKLCTKKYV